MQLLQEIRSCKLCEKELPFAPRPVLNFSAGSKILIVGQAPGIKVHNTGIPWNDASGERLREWLGVERNTFYDVPNFAIVPMAFCYPGRGKSGDLPPRPECSQKWLHRIIPTLKNKKLAVLIGQYAHHYYLQDRRKETLTETVKNWREYLPNFFVLPHPSPRNNIWLKKNPWFERSVLPTLKATIAEILEG